MRRISWLIGLFVIMLAAIGPADANICAFDNVPAATLLFPFVAIDYNDLWAACRRRSPSPTPPGRPR